MNKLVGRVIGRMSVVASCLVFVSASAQGEIVTQDIEGGGTALIVSGTAFTGEETTALNGNTVQELWKTGSTTLSATGIGSFTGVIRVKEGVYKVAGDTTGAGATAAKVYVTQGGTFYTTVNLGADKEVHIAGTGSGAYTALVKNGATMKLVLDDDASVSFMGNWCTFASSVDMGGHTLTLGFCGDASGGRSESVWPKSVNVTNPGNIVIDGASSKANWTTKLTFLYNSSQMQGSEHTITVKRGDLDWYSSAKYDTNWKLVCEGDATIGVSGGTTGGAYRWSGPIEVTSGATLNLAPTATTDVRVAGDISGAGTVVVGSSEVGRGRTVYLSGENTYEGTTIIRNANLYALSKKSFGSDQASRVSFNTSAGGALILRAKCDAVPDGYVTEDVQSVLDAQPSATVYVGVEEGETFSYDAVLGTALTGYLGSWGAGTLQYTAAATDGNVLRFKARTNIVVTAGADAETRVSAPGNLKVVGGRVTLADAGTFAVARGNGDIATYGSTEPYPELIVTGRTTFVEGLNAKGERSATRLNVAVGSACGRVEICAGAVMTNEFFSSSGNGNAALVTGEVIQREGAKVTHTQSGNDGYWGQQNSSFCYTLEGGTLTVDKYMHLANASTTRSMSMIRIAGGTLKKVGTGDLQLGWGRGTGVVYQTGGTYNQTGSGNLRFNSNNWANSAKGGFALWASEGTNSLVELPYIAIMGENTNSVSHLAINDGATFFVPAVERQTTQPNGHFGPDQMVGNLCYVHFNGGILKKYWNTNKPNILGTNGVDQATGVNYSTAPDKVVVYEGGATINVPAGTANLSTTLEEPQGLGVKAITLPDDTDREGWYGGIHVAIYGEGAGATAVAQYDTVNHRLTGVKVTSPGWGYREGTTRAVVSMGGKTGEIECTVTLGESRGGGFTKAGPGVLYVDAAQAYTGRTKIADGTLNLRAEGSLPSGTTLEFGGGMILFGPNEQPTSYSVDFAEAKEKGGVLYNAAFAFPEGATLTVENFTPPAADEKTFTLLRFGGAVVNPPQATLPGGAQPTDPWELKWRGNRLCCRNKCGCVLILR